MTETKREMSEIIDTFWIEKYQTYVQTVDGDVRSTDTMFLAEYVLKGDVEDADLFEAECFQVGQDQPIASYSGADRLWCNRMWVNRKVRSFDSLERLDEAFPPSNQYIWRISGPVFSAETRQVCLGGAEEVTNIPKVHAVRLLQEGLSVVNNQEIDSTKPLLVEWDPFPQGKAGEIFDDLVFLFVDNFHGDVVYFGGLPIDPDYITFRSSAATIPAGSLNPGEPYTLFFSQCRMVDQTRHEGVNAVAVNSFGLELELHTQGDRAPDACQGERCMAPFRWKRKTRVEEGLETWPTILDD